MNGQAEPSETDFGWKKIIMNAPPLFEEARELFHILSTSVNNNNSKHVYFDFPNIKMITS